MIGKAIAYILTNDATLSAQVGDRVYPISSTTTDMPAIFYRVGRRPSPTKNGYGADMWVVTIMNMCNTYDEAWAMSGHIQEIIENSEGASVEGFRMSIVTCTAVDDEYEFNTDTFGQTITFNITTQKR